MTAVAGDTEGRGHDPVAASPPASRRIQLRACFVWFHSPIHMLFYGGTETLIGDWRCPRGRFGEPGPQTAATSHTSRGCVGA